MRTVQAIGLVVGMLGLTGCATGIASSDPDSTDPGGDAGSSPFTHDAAPSNNNTAHDSGYTPQTAQDSGAMNTNTCSGTMCGATCVDTTSDSNNCGACSNVCPTGSTCVSSVCACSSGTLCSSSCVDTQTDNANCGSCGNTCSTSETCTAGTCTATSDAPPQGSCSHSLCTKGKELTDTCDTEGCTYEICDVVGDYYCCSVSWDATCISEVTTYCGPYSCM